MLPREKHFITRIARRPCIASIAIIQASLSSYERYLSCISHLFSGVLFFCFAGVEYGETHVHKVKSRKILVLSQLWTLLVYEPDGCDLLLKFQISYGTHKERRYIKQGRTSTLQKCDRWESQRGNLISCDAGWHNPSSLPPGEFWCLRR